VAAQSKEAAQDASAQPHIWNYCRNIGAIGLAAGAALAFLYGRFYARTRIELARFTIEMTRPGLPAEGLIILHLSDLHCRARERVQALKLARLRRLLAGESYDLVLFTGDLIHDTAGLPAALAFLAELRPRLGFFSVPGNRDYWESGFTALLGTAAERAERPLAAQLREGVSRLRRMLRQVRRNERFTLGVRPNDVAAMHAALAAQGIQPLVNRAVQVAGPDVDLWLAGVDDLTRGAPDLAAALAGVPAEALLVLLAHNPDAWLTPGAERADLVLSGHTHGGQIRLPLVGALYRQGTRIPRRQAAGWFARGRTRMFVSRGLGESFPFRLGAAPQAALIHLRPAGRGQDDQ
jgi:hypothetical protein